ncbi:MAG: class I SAM-dependent methyltransferase, partial [Proteobacteria bacterium]|nr:class I SAM-dependent methyltransferase [Pseudomonadota bacterium]
MSYNDNYSLIAYGQMIEDLGRFQPWLDALRRHIHEDSVVLDIGCGPGAMSFLACRFGARKVYAIEPDGSIEMAKRCAAGIPGAERIE